jgi:uncharacterized membrane protein YccC
MRVALSYYVANGCSVALGLALITAGVHAWLGLAASTAASVGVLVCAPPDLAAPRRGKFFQMLPAPLLSVPLFFAVQWLHTAPLRLGLLIVVASFFAFLAMAWGKRGIPIAIAVVFSMIFSMATPPPATHAQALSTTWHFALGAGLYVVWAVLANLALNARYRVQFTADLLLSLAALLRTQARQFSARDEASDVRAVGRSALGEVLRAQAALADQLQATRDIVLESPRTPRRQQLAAMLVVVLEMRDHLLASELDLDALKADPANANALAALREVLEELATDVEALADALLFVRTPVVPPDLRPRLAGIRLPQDAHHGASPFGPTHAMLARGMANRIGHLNDEVQRLCAIATGAQSPDLAIVRANWQMFVSPTAWSIAPFFKLWRWDAPPLRHAIRAALALGAGYAIAVSLPWGSHDYWVLLTISVVLRGSLSQTLERRNHRVAGTLLGCVLAVGLLSTHPSPLVLLLCVTVVQAVAHAFAVRRYLITAVAATVLGLVQAHMLNVGSSPTFALFERIFDTLLGAGIAWAFCYVLPSWERTLIPSLIRRTLNAQARHARLALGLGQLRSIDPSPELDWRLARREAYDSLSALIQATQRSLSEPRAVRPPIEPLEHLQAHGYQLLAQLSAVKSMLVLRRDRLTPEQVEGPMQRAAAIIETALTEPANSDTPSGAPIFTAGGPVPLPDPFTADISPWLLRRLDFAARLARQLQGDAARVLRPIDETP